MPIEHPSPPRLHSERKATGLVQPEQIPASLLDHAQWVCWRYIDRGQRRKPDKQPINARTLGNAGVHWANAWTSFEEAYTTYLRSYNKHIDGIGFVLTQPDPYVAVDLDGCVNADGIGRTAAQVMNELGSYTEISPSGHGLRILLACPEFHDNIRRAAIEVYSHSRYVTITGQHVADTPSTISIASADVIAALVPQLPAQGASRQMHTPKPELNPVSDRELWERIFAHDKYGHITSDDFKATVRSTAMTIRSPSFAS